ncbi:hypothetical protein [Pontibacter sp. G13]|uniref:hypothetical protein n=1 Tax=Pontibacter sp. G13 TaxID=3074898 RepID=UPI0028898DCE|nr:hypothetical protein [Pontibacter sp. G13]WNJ18343.1 hypothetical protein RJD25_26110 [Pontibacter sp. G13]
MKPIFLILLPGLGFLLVVLSAVRAIEGPFSASFDRWLMVILLGYLAVVAYMGWRWVRSQKKAQ